MDAYTGRTFTAKVSRISQTDVTSSWDTSSSTSSSTSSASVIYYYVTLDVDDPENVLLPGMTARVDINTSEKPNALAVPISALKANTSGSYVLLVNADGSTMEQPVTTGIYSDEYVEILDGLSEGDQISNTYKAAAATATSTKKSNSGGHGGPPM